MSSNTNILETTINELAKFYGELLADCYASDSPTKSVRDSIGGAGLALSVAFGKEVEEMLWTAAEKVANDVLTEWEV